MANLLLDLLSMLKVHIIDKVKPNGLLVLSGFVEKHHRRTFASFDWFTTICVIYRHHFNHDRLKMNEKSSSKISFKVIIFFQ